MEPSDTLRTFRRSLYECFHRRGDALFELTDAILAADGAATSPAHLSLQASHRRGWGSLYAALDRGRMLARACVEDIRLPWERRYDAGRLTPLRVHRAVSSLLMHLDTPAKAPKPCGRSPGRPKGRLSGRAKRYPALKKAA